MPPPLDPETWPFITTDASSLIVCLGEQAYVNVNNDISMMIISLVETPPPRVTIADPDDTAVQQRAGNERRTAMLPSPLAK